MKIGVSFTVLHHNPFTVKYRDNSTGSSKIVEYKVALLPQEMEEEAKSIVFDEAPKSAEYKNIPSNSLAVITKKEIRVKAIIKTVVNAEIAFTAFALVQFIHGFNPSVSKDHLGSAVLLQKLAMQLMAPDDAKAASYTIEELTLLRKWLDNRMRHCETERDAGKNTFNPDTYIGQKLLLLDLRELMLGEIVEIL